MANSHNGYTSPLYFFDIDISLWLVHNAQRNLLMGIYEYAGKNKCDTFHVYLIITSRFGKYFLRDRVHSGLTKRCDAQIGWQILFLWHRNL